MSAGSASGEHPDRSALAGGPVGLAYQDVVDRLRSAGCVFAEDEAKVIMSSATDPADLLALLSRRAAGTPLEHLLGWAEFCGRKVAVETGVFVPRRRSELLVREALRGLRSSAAPVVVDLCCGSGAIGVAIALALPDARLHGVDVDPVAVGCARRNLTAVGGHVHTGDLYAALPKDLRGAVNVIVANAPYVPTAQIPLMPVEAREHEPRTALDGGSDGLAVQRRIIFGAPAWLAPGGHLLVETSQRQGTASMAALAAAGLSAELVHDAELDATVVIGS